MDQLARRAGRRIEWIGAGHTQRWALSAAVHEMQRRGEVRIVGAPAWSQEAGEWQMMVERLRDPAPAWRRPVTIAIIIIMTLGSLIGAGWWLLASLAALPAAITLGVILLGFLYLVAAGQHRGRQDSVSVSVNVLVKRR